MKHDSCLTFSISDSVVLWYRCKFMHVNASYSRKLRIYSHENWCFIVYECNLCIYLLWGKDWSPVHAFREHLWNEVEQQVHHLVHACHKKVNKLSSLSSKNVHDLLSEEAQVVKKNIVSDLLFSIIVKPFGT